MLEGKSSKIFKLYLLLEVFYTFLCILHLQHPFGHTFIHTKGRSQMSPAKLDYFVTSKPP